MPHGAPLPSQAQHTAKPRTSFLAGEKESEAVLRQSHERSGVNWLRVPVLPAAQVNSCDKKFDIGTAQLVPRFSPFLMNAALRPKRHVLIVSHNFPPILGPDSVLMRMWALAIHRRGWKVTVLTTTDRHWNLKADPGLLLGLPEDMEIIRVASPEGKLGRYPRLRNVVYRTLAALGVPDIHLGWQYPVMNRMRPWMRTNRPDLIYSRQPKHVSAVVAMRLKQEFNVPWIAHFSDLWAALPYRDQRTARQWRAIEALEAQEMGCADALLFVGKRAADMTLARYAPSVRARATLIRHGYETLPETVPNVVRTGGGELHMVHAGAFYPGISGPQGLFEAISMLHRERSLAGRFKLTCVGPDTVEHQHLVDKFGIGEVVSLMPILPFAQAQRKIGEADLLLVVPYDPTSMPTKLFEYFAFQKPVLGLALDDGETADVMKDCGLPVVPPNDVPAILEQLRRMLAQWEQNAWGLSHESRLAIERYHIDRQAAIAEEAMDRLVARDR